MKLTIGTLLRVIYEKSQDGYYKELCKCMNDKKVGELEHKGHDHITPIYRCKIEDRHLKESLANVTDSMAVFEERFKAIYRQVGEQRIKNKFAKVVYIIQCDDSIGMDTILDETREITKAELDGYSNHSKKDELLEIMANLIVWTLKNTENKDGEETFKAIKEEAFWEGELEHNKEVEIMMHPHISEIIGQMIQSQMVTLNEATIEDAPQDLIISTTRPLQPSKFFMGREKEIEKITQSIKGIAKTVALTGMGGIGKTEICRNVFHMAINGEIEGVTQVAWLPYQNSLKETIFNKLIPVNDKGLQDIDSYYKEALEYCDNEKILIIIDNANEMDSYEEVSLLKGKCKIIINSRKGIDYQRIAPIYIDGIGLENCIELYLKHFYADSPQKGEDYTDKVLAYTQKIVEKTHKHTLAVELLAKTHRYSMESFETFYNRVDDTGFSLTDILVNYTHNPEELKDTDEYERAFNQQFAKIFAISGLEERLVHILAKLALLKHTVIRIESLNKWLKDNLTMDDIDNLNRRGWISKGDIGEDERGIQMHPIIAATMRYTCSPTDSEENKMTNNFTADFKVQNIFEEKNTQYEHAMEFLKNTRREE